MKKIEKILYTEGNKIQNMTPTDKLDKKMNDILYPLPKAFNFKKLCITCAATVLAIVIFTVTAVGVRNSDFTGFDSVTVDTVAEAIHRENAFQPKSISHTFSNGTTVTVNGLVVDNDRMMIFGTADKESTISLVLLNSSKKELCHADNGVIDFDKQEYNFTFEIKPSKLKNCLIQIICDGETQIFALNPDIFTAKKRVYKIQKDFEYEGTTIDLKSLQSNLTSCVLDYKILFPKELREQSGWFENEPEIYVNVDNQNLGTMSSSMTSWLQLGKLSFSASKRFEPIPPQTQKVTILIKTIPVLKTEPIKLNAEIGSKGTNATAEFEIIDILKEYGKTKVAIKGNCLFFKDNVTAELDGVPVMGERVNWARDEKEEFGYTHYYEFDGDINIITIEKYVCNVNVNKIIELK